MTIHHHSGYTITITDLTITPVIGGYRAWAMVEGTLLELFFTRKPGRNNAMRELANLYAEQTQEKVAFAADPCRRL